MIDCTECSDNELSDYVQNEDIIKVLFIHAQTFDELEEAVSLTFKYTNAQLDQLKSDFEER